MVMKKTSILAAASFALFVLPMFAEETTGAPSDVDVAITTEKPKGEEGRGKRLACFSYANQEEPTADITEEQKKKKKKTKQNALV